MSVLSPQRRDYLIEITRYDIDARNASAWGTRPTAQTSKPPMQRTVALLASTLVLLASCSSTSSTATTTITVPVPSTTTRTVTTVVRAESDVNLAVSYGCGPTDGAWLTAHVSSMMARQVVVQLEFEGQTYGTSYPTVLGRYEGDKLLGFAPGTPTAAFGKIVTIAVYDTSDPTVVLAAEPLRLQMDEQGPGWGCG